MMRPIRYPTAQFAVRGALRKDRYARAAYAKRYMIKRARTGKNKSVTSKAAARSMSTAVAKRASIFRNGANQAVRLPQELRFPADVKEVRIRKQGDGLFITPVKPNWGSFFRLQADAPDNFLENRHDSPPQSRDHL
jgi:antitoxin VapB